jgi:hypothetical protein
MSDLQPKYAQRINHDDDNPDAHGWYAGLSESRFPIHVVTLILTIVTSFSPQPG